MDILKCDKNKLAEDDNIVVVRLITSSWSDKRGVHLKKSLIYLKRKCRGFNLLEEDSMHDAEEVMSKIVNLHTADDGIYKVIICNEKKDWETGFIDDYDYKLVKIE